MAGISSLGIGSGLDINSIVTQLVQAETQPKIDQITSKQNTLQTRLSALGTLKGALSSLQDAAFTLWKSATFNSRTVSSSNPAVATASAGTGVVPGQHQLSIDQLAQGQRLVTDPQAIAGARLTSASAVLGTGTLTFRFGTTTFVNGAYSSFTEDPNHPSKTIPITDGSLTGIANAINSANIGINASVVFDGTYYRLALAGTDTGAANSMEITVADDDGTNLDGTGLSVLGFNASATNMQQTQAAQNTSGLVVDGIAIDSASNTLTGAISGVTVNLLAPGSTSLTVSADNNTASNAINDFVAKYNALITTINQLASYDAQSGKAGPLLGDNVLFSVQTRIGQVMSQLFGSSSAVFRQLADIGISHNPSDGTLVVDATKLQNSLVQDGNAVGALMKSYGKPLDDLLSGMLSSAGLFQTTTDSINAMLTDLDARRAAVQDRAQLYQARLKAQFTAMDQLVSQLRSTGDYLTSQFSALLNTKQSR
jgi:flagellar hook-associated protein 2